MRECENHAYFVILAHICDLGAPTVLQNTEKWRILVSFVHIVVLFSTILVVDFRSFPLISVDPVVRDLTETSILLAETVNACAYVFLLSLLLTQDGKEIYLCLPPTGSGDILFFTVRLSVRLSVSPSVHLSVCPSQIVSAL